MARNGVSEDLLDVLQAEYEHWKRTGNVRLGGVEAPLKLPDEPAGTQVPVIRPMAAPFCDFARAYLALNPVVSTGSALGAFGVVLADRRHVLFARDDSGPRPMARGGAFPISGADQGRDVLPPSHAIPITTGG